jgi:agmatine deiminase
MAEAPAKLGYRMPAEWGPHEATWLAWPHNGDDWPGKFAPIPWVYGEIVRHLTASEKVRLLVPNRQVQARAKRVLARCGADLSRVEYWRVPTDRSWVRDSGPLFLTTAGGRLALTDWKFTAWAKYPNWQQDDAVPRRINARLRLPVWKPKVRGRPVVLEGGAIDVNGQGCLLATEECLLSRVQQRNPGLGREEYEQVFADYLGIRKVLWLGQGLAGDDTHGHVDDLARFVGPRTVVAVVEMNRDDPNYGPLQDNLQRLRGMADQAGRPLEVVPLPMPAPLFFAGRRLPASYANFYVANSKVLVPTFNDSADRRALGILADLFPGREVVGIHAVDLVWGLGTLHCLTLQQPDRDIGKPSTENTKEQE